MAITLVATVGDATANTYATRAEANAYAEGSAYAAVWAALADTDAARGPFLVRAARALDTLGSIFSGVPATAVQALQWPRAGVTHPSGTAYGTSEIPRAVKDAQSLVAAWLAAQAAADATADPFGADGVANIASVSAGPVSVDFRAGAGTSGQDVLRRLVHPILAAGGCAAPPGVVPLLR